MQKMKLKQVSSVDFEYFQTIRARNNLDRLRKIIIAPNVDSKSLAHAIETGGLSRQEVTANDELLFRVTRTGRVDLINTLLSIPGWSFERRQGNTVCHIAATYPENSALFFLLLAAPEPAKMLDHIINDSGKTVRQLAIEHQHPLTPFFDYLIKGEYPKILLSYITPLPPEHNYFTKQQLTTRYPQIASYFSMQQIPKDEHLLKTLSETIRYLPRGTEPFSEIACVNGNHGNNNIEHYGDFFTKASKNGARIIYLAESTFFYNPGNKYELNATLVNYQETNKQRFSLLTTMMPLDMQANYHRCLQNNDRLACLTIAYENEGFFGRLAQPFCRFLENNILIISAGNQGRDIRDELNYFTLNWPCSERALNHRIIATRAETTADPTLLEQLRPITNYGPESYLFSSTAFHSIDCETKKLCAIFRNQINEQAFELSGGTSYSAPQALGVVLQIASVLKQKGIPFNADMIINTLNQGCVKPDNSTIVKCIVDPQAVFLAAANYTAEYVGVDCNDVIFHSATENMLYHDKPSLMIDSNKDSVSFLWRKDQNQDFFEINITQQQSIRQQLSEGSLHGFTLGALKGFSNSAEYLCQKYGLSASQSYPIKEIVFYYMLFCTELFENLQWSENLLTAVLRAFVNILFLWLITQLFTDLGKVVYDCGDTIEKSGRKYSGLGVKTIGYCLPYGMFGYKNYQDPCIYKIGANIAAGIFAEKTVGAIGKTGIDVCTSLRSKKT